MKLLINIFPFIISFLGELAVAQTTKTTSTTMSVMSILPAAATNMSDVVVDSQVRVTRTDNAVTFLDLYVSCFGTNLRSVANPISPKSMIHGYFEYQNPSGAYETFKLTFPAYAAVVNQNLSGDVVTAGVVDAADNITSTWNVSMKSNLIRIHMKNTKTQSVDVTSSGVTYGQVTDVNAKSSFIKSIRFDQIMPTPTAPVNFMGGDGPLSANLTWYTAENGKYVTVYAAFPGENHFCGGFFSPLMLSFDQEPPDLNKSASFKLYKNEESIKGLNLKYSWPDVSKKEIYFLAVDKNKNGKIDSGEELFGDVNGYEDGFKNLAAYDDNKDGVIDKNDKIFADLVLWRDINSDGKSQKSEIKTLAEMGVTSISVKAKAETRYVGERGKIVGPAGFEFKNKKGELKQGNVWDVFVKLVK